VRKTVEGEYVAIAVLIIDKECVIENVDNPRAYMQQSYEIAADRLLRHGIEENRKKR